MPLKGEITDIVGLTEVLEQLQAAIEGYTSAINPVIVPGVQSRVQWGSVVADAAGTMVTLTTPFADTNYFFAANGTKDHQMVMVALGDTTDGTKTPQGIRVYPAEDGTTVFWFAIGGILAL